LIGGFGVVERVEGVYWSASGCFVLLAARGGHETGKGVGREGVAGKADWLSGVNGHAQECGGEVVAGGATGIDLAPESKPLQSSKIPQLYPGVLRDL
jgi:hypothetical protein